MPNVTKSTYVNNINTLRVVAASTPTALSGTDIARASAAGIYITHPSNIPGNASTASLTDAVVTGDQITNLLVQYTTLWTRSRRVLFNRLYSNDGIILPDLNDGPGGKTPYSYLRYAYVQSPTPSYTGPHTTNSLFNPLDTGNDIDLSTWNSIISTMNAHVNNYKNITQHTINYCHDSCHSSCHVSRGRR